MNRCLGRGSGCLRMRADGKTHAMALDSCEQYGCDVPSRMFMDDRHAGSRRCIELVNFFLIWSIFISQARHLFVILWATTLELF